jgi:hypothetical protein
MERTVPSTASEEIELYLRTYYSLLRTTAEIQIRTLEEAHARTRSLLHPHARETYPDVAAFFYANLRLPRCMPEVDLVVLGQSPAVFSDHGYEKVEAWQEVTAPARRRLCYFDGDGTLACFIASRTDIDDIIPMLTAYQIEWNKFHRLLQQLPSSVELDRLTESTLDREPELLTQLADALWISLEDIEQWRVIWGDEFLLGLRKMARRPVDFHIRLLSGSLSEYWRATRIWWENIQYACPELRDRPVYFVSSNPHSLINLVSGYPLKIESQIVEFLNRPGNKDLLGEWRRIQEHEVDSSRENFLYYALKKIQQSEDGEALSRSIASHERSGGVLRIPSQHSFDLEAQVIDLARLNPDFMDPRLGEDLIYLSRSDAFILNIDYPLGLSAYNILSKVAEHAGNVLGVYVIGKAATLNGVIGDVMIPNVVHDEQSQNTYLFSNCITAAHVEPYLIYGTVLDHQKAVTVRGTFLQNDRYMDVFYREGYTDIEMEAGPYLSAVYEMYRPKRHPTNEIVNLYELPFDLGIVHYASDTPLGKGRNLGVGNLSYYGMDSSYAVSLAILRRIFQLERNRLN